MRWTAIITCMGRRACVERTLPEVLRLTEAHVCLVDYSCPERIGDWAQQQYGHTTRLTVQHVAGRKVFSKPEALNYGAACAIEEGIEDLMLVFLDADTLVTELFWPWVLSHVFPSHFYFVEGSTEHADLTGVLVVSAEQFFASGGYDESFSGWGAEDLDMRLKLYFKQSLPFVQMPGSLLESVPHDDALRVEHYWQKDRYQSLYYNLQRLLANVTAWTGKDLREQLSDDTSRLLGVYGAQAAQLLSANSLTRSETKESQ